MPMSAPAPLFRRALAGLATALAAFAALTPSAAAQEAPPSMELGFLWDSGPVANQGRGPAVVISKTIYVQDAQWLQLSFQLVQLAGDPELGDNSLLRVTSFKDGAVQEMNQVHVLQWQNRTAYFNGDALQVEVLAQPGTGTNRVITRMLTVGLPLFTQYSQCGPTDDRVPSFEAGSARALPIGCTAWLFDDCNKCFGTAGHCSTTSLQTIQFNVPPSNSNGSLNHPPPQHQYAVDVSSKQSQNGGIGLDWGYFGCFPNSNTGLTPFQSQNAAYVLALTPPPFSSAHTIRITGYGTDSGTANQTQQTHSGPWASWQGTTLRYTVDTTGGNSGSAVQWQNGNQVIGVHTHAGCSTSNPPGSNQGTSVTHPNWLAARNTPKGVCNPIGSSSVYCTAKVNSLGCTSVISSTGTPKLSGAPGSFRIQAAQVQSAQPGLLFYGFLPDTAPFAGGFRCIAPPTTRTNPQGSGGSGTGTDCTGSFDFDMAGHILSGVDPALVCGAIVYAQYWCRDPGFGAPNNVGLTAGVRFQIGM